MDSADLQLYKNQQELEKSKQQLLSQLQQTLQQIQKNTLQYSQTFQWGSGKEFQIQSDIVMSSLRDQLANLRKAVRQNIAEQQKQLLFPKIQKIEMMYMEHGINFISNLTNIFSTVVLECPFFTEDVLPWETGEAKISLQVPYERLDELPPKRPIEFLLKSAENGQIWSRAKKSVYYDGAIFIGQFDSEQKIFSAGFQNIGARQFDGLQVQVKFVNEEGTPFVYRPFELEDFKPRTVVFFEKYLGKLQPGRYNAIVELNHEESVIRTATTTITMT